MVSVVFYSLFFQFSIEAFIYNGCLVFNTVYDYSSIYYY